MAGSQHFLTPHSRDIYKIIDVQKGGFSLRLQNLRTLGELTKVHTRVDYLSLEDINSFELGSNDPWDNLTDLNRLNRQSFKQGESKRKLQLIHPEPEGEENGEVEDSLGSGKEDDVKVDNDDEDLLNIYDEDDAGDQSGGPESTNNIISENNKTRYNLRPRKAVNKTVRLTDIRVNKTDIGPGNKIQSENA